MANDEELKRNLVALGATPDEIEHAAKLGHRHLQALRSTLLLYPGGKLDAASLGAQTGVAVDDLVDWWRTLGLPDPTQAGARLGDAEVAVAENLAAGLSLVPRDAFFEFGVAFGTAMRQVASAIMELMQATLVRDLAKRGAAESEISSTIGELAGMLADAGTPALMGLLRLHLVAAVYESLELEDEERGSRTILFVDLVDYTSLAQRVDARELSSILSALEALSMATALETDGRVVKFLGDGVLLAFHHPSEAIRAARALVADHPALPARRAGMSTGPVLARQGDYFGATVNLAARLAAAAKPGEIFTDNVAVGVELQRVGKVALKGFDEPIAAYRVAP